MAAPRSLSSKILRNLRAPKTSVPGRRSLNITGSKASPYILSPPPRHIYAPLTISDLRNECRRRSILPTGNKDEIVVRLVNHDNMQSRAFSIAAKKLRLDKREDRAGRRVYAQNHTSRHFNTSRELKSVNDSSTMDFAYLPKLFDGSLDPPGPGLRVPILPDVESAQAQSTLSRNPELEVVAGGDLEADSHDQNVMKATIVTVEETMADGGAHVDLDLKGHASAMSEVVDNHAVEIGIENLTGLAETVGKSARKLVGSPEESAVSRVWTGFLDDVLGPKK